MKYKYGRILAVSVVLILLMATVAGGAKAVIRQVKVAYRGITIYVNGQPVDSPVEPFILVDEKRTMVPIRFVSEALGKQVVWDSQASAIYIGEPPAGTTVEKLPSDSFRFIDDMKVIRNVGPFYQQKTKPFAIAGRLFSHGVAVEIDEKERNKAEVVLDLNGQYSYMAGYIGVEDETRNSSGSFILSVYGNDVELYRSHQIKPSDYPFPVSLGNLENIKRLTIRVEWQPGGIGDYSRVIAALANVKFYRK
ncbi:stalk domain-containing protein [Calderihabitans maritimus]|uniref:Copper amine oxidase-like N-terminal domain-containing protein n=1 Tax=Calderihabitans maritimus TaxID=1246530 RepID=A0A1Z5HX85_9FIRM|nr:stalk domain-containing protein [Calderihabitans maritimus]GAW94142.1 hypothetical protein Toce_1920 [Calderihabitans maritimus]